MSGNKLVDICNYFRLPPKTIMGNIEDYIKLYDNRFEEIFK